MCDSEFPSLVNKRLPHGKKIPQARRASLGGVTPGLEEGGGEGDGDFGVSG